MTSILFLSTELPFCEKFLTLTALVDPSLEQVLGDREVFRNAMNVRQILEEGLSLAVVGSERVALRDESVSCECEEDDEDFCKQDSYFGSIESLACDVESEVEK